MSGDTKFKRMYMERFEDEICDADKVRRLVICNGQIYYELLEARREGKIDDVAIVSIEQLSPFPFDL